MQLQPPKRSYFEPEILTPFLDNNSRPCKLLAWSGVFAGFREVPGYGMLQLSSARETPTASRWKTALYNYDYNRTCCSVLSAVIETQQKKKLHQHNSDSHQQWNVGKCGEAGNTTVIGTQLYFTSVRQRYKHGGHVQRVTERERKTCFILSRVVT